MSTEEITRSAGSGNRVSGGPAHPLRGVVIVYAGRREGRAALRYAGALAGQGGVPLTVLSIASKERTDIGCGSCRQGAAFRNELACEFATGHLTEARDLLVSEGPADVAVDFALGRRARRGRSLIAADSRPGATVRR
jgi:hypothetical protein